MDTFGEITVPLPLAALNTLERLGALLNKGREEIAASIVSTQLLNFTSSTTITGPTTSPVSVPTTPDALTSGVSGEEAPSVLLQESTQAPPDRLSGDTVRALLRENKITISELAMLAEIPEGTIGSSLARGALSPRNSARICKLFNLTGETPLTPLPTMTGDDLRAWMARHGLTPKGAALFLCIKEDSLRRYLERANHSIPLGVVRRCGIYNKKVIPPAKSE